MNKCIVAVAGHKGNFQRAVEKYYEDEQYKVKVADCGEMLQTIIEVLGWDGNKDKKFYDFYNNLFKSANETFDFKNHYFDRAIQEFWDDKKSEVLLVKGSDELVEDLEDRDGIFNIFIAKNEEEINGNANKYDQVVLIDQHFENSVKNILDILLNKEIEKA
jgi:hypothetical protein